MGASRECKKQLIHNNNEIGVRKNPAMFFFSFLFFPPDCVEGGMGTPVDAILALVVVSHNKGQVSTVNPMRAVAMSDIRWRHLGLAELGIFFKATLLRSKEPGLWGSAEE